MLGARIARSSTPGVDGPLQMRSPTLRISSSGRTRIFRKSSSSSRRQPWTSPTTIVRRLLVDGLVFGFGAELLDVSRPGLRDLVREQGLADGAFDVLEI